ncbi:MAG: succinate--CoA ligase subunit alpha [Chlamydiota bacterium]
MAILINNETRFITQGITGTSGSCHTQKCIDYGTTVVGGVTPGKGGSRALGLPVYDTVWEARQALDFNASMIMVPAPKAAEAILEAEDAGVELIVCITEGIPDKDMREVRRVMNYSSTSRLIGPNCPGLITPGEAKIGIIPGDICRPGSVGIVSRSGTLTYEALWQLSQIGLGQSTCVGIGGDALRGTDFVDILEMFDNDPQTEAILMIGEIGGDAEERAASWFSAKGTKPLAAYIAGLAAPSGRRMGHAGAIVSQGQGTAESKIEALREAGAVVADNPANMGKAVLQGLKGGLL